MVIVNLELSSTKAETVAVVTMKAASQSVGRFQAQEIGWNNSLTSCRLYSQTRQAGPAVFR